MSITLLAIESSCDETAASVCRDGLILSNIVASQQIHSLYGGVVPELASRAHIQHIVPVVDQAFKIAGSMAIQDAARKANPVLLEPVMAVEVVTPEDFLGDVIGDLSRRRGKVQGQDQRGNALAVQAFVPLGEMFGSATELRSMTQGRANYTMQFERYEEVPGNIAEEIVEHRSGEPVGATS